MTVFRIAAAMALVGIASPAFAFGDKQQPAGRVASSSEGVFIARGGKLLQAAPGQVVYKGDRVVTRANGNATVALNSCNVTLKPTSTLTVGTSCTAQTLAASSTGLNGANAQDGDGVDGIPTETIVVGVLATAAVIGGAVAASQSDDTPSSP